jgi:hypothetical protein
MSFYSFTYLLVIIITLTCRSLSSIPIKTQKSNGKEIIIFFFLFILKIFEILENFIQNNEEFIPTNEWQIVKEGILNY